MGRTHRWRETIPEPDAYRPLAGLSNVARALEQDKAAGGREGRLVKLSETQAALASVALRLLPRTRRIYAYLRWSEAGRTKERYICEVTYLTRHENLAQAWHRAHALGFTEAGFAGVRRQAADTSSTPGHGRTETDANHP
jgi:DNA mismatch endonuclease (patch repair protein)